MRISDCSSDVCSSDLFRNRAKFRPRLPPVPGRAIPVVLLVGDKRPRAGVQQFLGCRLALADLIGEEREFLAVEAKATCCRQRSEEHTSELQSLMRISYAVFCLKKKKKTRQHNKK